LERCELGPPARDEVLVRIEACGICHTDLSAHDGTMATPLPAVLGHEGVGRIEALGPDVAGFEVGQRVLMSFGACGRCESCAQDVPAYCRNMLSLNMRGRRLDGSSPISLGGEAITGHFFAQSSFATHAVANITNLVRLDDDLPATLMAPLSCSVQTGMSSIVDVLELSANERVAIFGCGTVGLAAVMAARILGCQEIVAVDLREDRVALARELGATVCVVSGRDDLKAAVKAIGGVHGAFDCTGHPGVIESAFQLLLPRGQLVCAGVSPADATIRTGAMQLVFSGRSLRGTIEGDANPRAFIPRMIAWYREGKLPLERLVTAYPFREINQAVEDMVRGKVVKPVLVMSEA
jgi:aryl-alcohol dehydrogenase